jgi:putative Mg2+ transporter-C (MgtC) family protein
MPDAHALADTLRLDLLLKLALAVLLGGAIGLERQIAGKPAGLRTNILICLGSALLMDLSLRVGLGDGPARLGDPGRIAAQVVSGIGFIGAGTIMQARGEVTGLTTAATIWVVAAIGLAVGAGLYVEACGAGVMVTVVLAGLGNLEYRLLRARRTMSGTVRAARGADWQQIADVFHSGGLQVRSRQVFDHPDDRVFELKVNGPARQFAVVEDALMRRDDVLGVTFT